MKRIASDSAKNKIMKTKKRNRSTLCRYFTLIYPKEYAEGVAGGKCPK
jgi:hypothetical protein